MHRQLCLLTLLLPIIALTPTLAEEPTIAGDASIPEARYCNAWMFEPIAMLDAPYGVEAVTRDLSGTACADMDDWSTDQPSLLFEDLPADSQLHPSYDYTCDICDLLDHAQDSGDYAAIEPEIREYLAFVAEMPALQYALAVTGTTVDDLYDTWFGSGEGFEHAICGEKDESNPTNTGGYHFWYRFYQEERRQGDGHVNWRCSLEGIDDPDVATIRFDWNPLGNDEYRRKPIGGFTVGDSPAALLALGHIALHRDCDVADRANDLMASINGTAYEWVIVTRERSIHTLYPKALDRTLPSSAGF